MFLYRHNKASCSSNVLHSGMCMCICMYVYFIFRNPCHPAPPLSPYYTYTAVLVPQYCPIYQLHNHSALAPTTSEDYIKSFGYKGEMFRTNHRCVFCSNEPSRTEWHRSHLTLEAIFREWSDFCSTLYSVMEKNNGYSNLQLDDL